MSRLTGYDLLRLGAAMAAAGVLALACAACMSSTSPTPTAVEMLALPDGGGAVPMPPAWMRRQIEARMRQGKVPGYVEVSTGRIKDACRADEDLLGCVVTYHGLKVTYIRRGLNDRTRHMVLLHEYAHDLYDWTH